MFESIMSNPLTLQQLKNSISNSNSFGTPQLLRAGLTCRSMFFQALAELSPTAVGEVGEHLQEALPKEPVGRREDTDTPRRRIHMS